LTAVTVRGGGTGVRLEKPLDFAKLLATVIHCLWQNIGFRTSGPWGATQLPAGNLDTI
jgi:hypothetical protein